MLEEIYSKYGGEISFGYIYNVDKGVEVKSFKP